VAGFDDDPRAFLESSTARLRSGPLWTPFLTPLVLREGGRGHVQQGWHRPRKRLCGRFPRVPSPFDSPR
jgi:hypothetical protein